MYPCLYTDYSSMDLEELKNQRAALKQHIWDDGDHHAQQAAILCFAAGAGCSLLALCCCTNPQPCMLGSMSSGSACSIMSWAQVWRQDCLKNAVREIDKAAVKQIDRELQQRTTICFTLPQQGQQVVVAQRAQPQPMQPSAQY